MRGHNYTSMHAYILSYVSCGLSGGSRGRTHGAQASPHPLKPKNTTKSSLNPLKTNSKIFLGIIIYHFLRGCLLIVAL